MFSVEYKLGVPQEGWVICPNIYATPVILVARSRKINSTS